jgi:hypothetical protein
MTYLNEFETIQSLQWQRYLSCFFATGKVVAQSAKGLCAFHAETVAWKIMLYFSQVNVIFTLIVSYTPWLLYRRYAQKRLSNFLGDNLFGGLKAKG